MNHVNRRLALHAWWMGAPLLCMASCGSDYSDTANLNSTGTNIICFGDSITRGFGASEGMTYPDRLSSMIGGPVINAGVNGDTTASALQRLEEDVLSKDPWIVIIHLAGNDLVHRVPESETRKNLDTIVERCIDAGAIVVLVHAKFGILASDPYIDTYETVAERHRAVLIRHALKGILGNPKHMYDQIHPNDTGYALLADRVAAVVIPLAQTAEAARNGS